MYQLYLKNKPDKPAALIMKQLTIITIKKYR